MIYEKIAAESWDLERGIPKCPARGAFELHFHGNIWFVVDGKIHREDGPAIFANGFQLYYQHGRFHREDGPAMIWPDGAESYHLFNRQYTKEAWEPLATQLSIKGEIL